MAETRDVTTRVKAKLLKTSAKRPAKRADILAAIAGSTAGSTLAESTKSAGMAADIVPVATPAKEAATQPFSPPEPGFKPWFTQLPKDEGQPAPKPSAGEVTHSDAFKAWFAGSKVVDTEGKPLIAYHGTSSPSKQFLNVGQGAYAQLGHWFDADPATVHSYAGGKEEAHRSNLIPVYLSIKNPKNYPDTDHLKYAADGKFGGNFKARVQKLRKDLKKEGYDGVVIRNSVSTPGMPDYWVAFATEQIKSATGNSGGFDGQNKSILSRLETAK